MSLAGPETQEGRTGTTVAGRREWTRERAFRTFGVELGTDRWDAHAPRGDPTDASVDDIVSEAPLGHRSR